MWLVGVVSRRLVWLLGVGGIYGCGCKEVYRFPHSTYHLTGRMTWYPANIIYWPGLFTDVRQYVSYCYQCKCKRYDYKFSS